MNLSNLVEDLRLIAKETDGGIKRPKNSEEVIKKVSELVKRFVEARNLWWDDKYYTIHPEKGFETHILHQEPDHTLAIIVVSWEKGRSVPPHNHGSWSVVCGVEGKEQNTLWERTNPDINDSPLKELSKTVFSVGEIASFWPDTIHSVWISI